MYVEATEVGRNVLARLGNGGERSGSPARRAESNAATSRLNPDSVVLTSAARTQQMPAMPADPDLQLDDLKPYLGGWSPYGPLRQTF